MNLLKIDINKYIPDIIDAYTEVYGNEYSKIIKKRINNIFYVVYNNYYGINDYYQFLCQCKKRELALKFLSQIGIDVSEYENRSYALNFDEHLKNLLENYLDDFYMFEKAYDRVHYTGIKAFDINLNAEELKEVEKVIKTNRIKFLNYLRQSENEEITEENYDIFCQSAEYQKLLTKIKSYLKIYNELLKEYEEYLKEIEHYKTYIDSEFDRIKAIVKRKRAELLNEIYFSIPPHLQEIITKNKNKIFPNYLNGTYRIESFSKENNEKLTNPDISLDDKNWICYLRILCLKDLGLDIENITENEYEEYKRLLEREDVKRIIPSEDLASFITKQRETKNREAEKEFLLNNADFLKYAKIFNNKDTLFHKFQKKLVCINQGTQGIKNITLLFYTIRPYDGGYLDFMLLHEICHAIECSISTESFYISGFDIYIYDESLLELNPYNKEKRKYERLNETIADILASEATEILHQKGIYIIEPKQIIKKDVSNFNTHSIIKNMLTKFMTRYRKLILKARITGDPSELIKVVGVSNFETLNDIINKVDYLLTKGLAPKLKDNQEKDELVIEYYKELKRLDKVYDDMKKYRYSAIEENNYFPESNSFRRIRTL